MKCLQNVNIYIWLFVCHHHHIPGLLSGRYAELLFKSGILQLLYTCTQHPQYKLQCLGLVSTFSQHLHIWYRKEVSKQQLHVGLAGFGTYMFALWITAQFRLLFGQSLLIWDSDNWIFRLDQQYFQTGWPKRHSWCGGLPPPLPHISMFFLFFCFLGEGRVTLQNVK